MDSISRESNISSYLPIAGLIVGGLAILLSIVALVKSSAANKDSAAHIASLESKIETIEGIARNADNNAMQGRQAQQSISKLASDVQRALTQAGDAINENRSNIDAIKTALAKPRATSTTTAATASSGTAAPQRAAAVAGSDEYIVKSGDTGSKIAASAGVRLADLMSVNPDVNWNRLHVGQKLKLPKK